MAEREEQLTAVRKVSFAEKDRVEINSCHPGVWRATLSFDDITGILVTGGNGIWLTMAFMAGAYCADKTEVREEEAMKIMKAFTAYKTETEPNQEKESKQDD